MERQSTIDGYGAHALARGGATDYTFMR